MYWKPPAKLLDIVRGSTPGNSAFVKHLLFFKKENMIRLWALHALLYCLLPPPELLLRLHTRPDDERIS